MNNTTRRQFLRTSGAVALGFTGLLAWQDAVSAGPADAMTARGYGPLIPDPHKFLDLPEGFTYRVLSRTGETMDDGLLVPGLHEGMATFPGPNGRTIIVRNHEVTPDKPDIGAFGSKNERLKKIELLRLYDPGKGVKPSLGGTTTLVYDTREQRLERHFLSLGGTIRNCAGGPTPWGSWITCEETLQRPDGDIERDHGYNFEVPASADIRLTQAIPLKEMGRFNHEAVAVDPKSGIVYQTEDIGDGLLYRYVPRQPGRLAAGGRLQALKFKGQKSVDTRNWTANTIPVGKSFSVEWVDIENVESPDNDLRYQGFFARGAARFARGEGMWTGRDAIYFACTNGGAKKLGQIWRYVPSSEEGRNGEGRNPGKLELFVEPNNGSLVENADNLTISPWGDIYVCEDGPSHNGIAVVTPEGRVYRFANNLLNTSEMAGATFSPDGSTLFVNIQTPGLTLAITGPWKRWERG